MISTTTITHSQILTIRAYMAEENTIIATYAVGKDKTYKTGSKTYRNTSKKAIKRCKLEILNQALLALGEGKNVRITVTEKFLQNFITEGKLINESYYQDIVDELRFNLSLCSSVACSEFIPKSAFEAALREYKHAKYDLLPDTDPYKFIKIMTDKRIQEARQRKEAELAGQLLH